MAITVVVALSLTEGYAQKRRHLTKEAVLKHWNSSNYERQNDSAVVKSSSVLNLLLTKFIDSLAINNIDSVIVFSTSYPGYNSTSKCDAGFFPIKTYIIWNKNGETFIRKLQGACSLEISKGTSLHLFNYYTYNHAKLKSEFFMPVIFNAHLNKDKTISYLMTDIDHEPNYSFFYKIGTDRRSFQFCESFLEDKQSLFHDYNRALKAYSWWSIVKKELDLLN